jgi:hypothetical protein
MAAQIRYILKVAHEEYNRRVLGDKVMYLGTYNELDFDDFERGDGSKSSHGWLSMVTGSPALSLPHYGASIPPCTCFRVHRRPSERQHVELDCCKNDL